MFSHIMVGTTNIERSRRFYDATFATLGIVDTFEDSMGRVFWRGRHGSFAIALPIDGRAASVGNGSTVAFDCDTGTQVNAWHAAGVANGGTSIEDKPGIRDAGTPLARYLAYLRDPDGNKLCAMRFIGT